MFFSLFKDIVSTIWGGAALTNNGSASGPAQMTLERAVISGNTAKSNGGAVSNYAVSGDAVLTASDVLFSDNGASNAASTHGGAVFNFDNDSGHTAKFTLEGGTFLNNTAHNGGAIFTDSEVNLSDVLFYGNTAWSHGGAIYSYGGTVTIDGGTFATVSDTIDNEGNLTFRGAVTLNAELSGSGSVTAAAGTVITVGAVDFEASALTLDGTLALNGNGTLTAEISGSGVLSVADGVQVTFIGSTLGMGKLLNSGTIIVNGNLDAATYTLFTYDNSWTVGTIAAGANGSIYHGAAAQKYYYYNIVYVDSTLAGNVGDEVTITVAGREMLALYGVNAFAATADAKAAKSAAGKDFTLIVAQENFDGNYYGDGKAVIGGGTIAKTTYGGRLIKSGTVTDADSALTIAGGTFGSMVVGGNRISVAGGSVSSVCADSASLVVTGGVFSSSKGYLAAAGYVINNQNNAVSAASLTVGTADLTLSGAEVTLKKYALGGAFVDHGTASIETVNVAVTAGTYESVFAGGWAQNGGQVTVTGADIHISGGSIHNLYAGGTDGGDGNTTSAGTVTMTISGGIVKNVFLNGKYSRDTVTTATLNVTSTADICWIEGLCHSLQASSAVTNTTLNLSANLTVEDILDVDVWNLTKTGTLLDFGVHTADLNGSTETEVLTTIDFRIGKQDIGEGWTAIAAQSFEGLSESSIKVNGVAASAYSAESATWTFAGFDVKLTAYENTRKALVVIKNV